MRDVKDIENIQEAIPAHAVHEELMEHLHEAPKRIIAIPIDGSSYSSSALKWAIDNLIDPAHDQVVLLNVREPSAPIGFSNPYIDYGEFIDRVEESSRQVSHSLLKSKGAELVKLNIPTRAIALRGDPRTELERKMIELKVDMIVVGSRGMGAMKRQGLFTIANLLSAFIGSIAGMTVGMLVLPQGLAQAKIASLPPEYGLYTAFTGLLIYVFFATSKDVTIGPTAVLSLFTSQVLISANKDASGRDVYPPIVFAIALALMAGIYQLAVGLLRLGILIDFIPSTVISGFTTGAAVTIIIGQIPSLLGIKNIDTNSQPCYLIVRDIFAKLGTAKVDAAIGFTCLFLLAGLKWIKERWGRPYRWAYYLGIARNGLALVFYTLLSYLITTFTYNGIPPFGLVGHIPRGFRGLEIPLFDAAIITRVAGPAVSVALIGVVEHVAIGKSFARQNDYAINPSQEIIAIGMTNVFGSFFGAYPATGSFSRSAVKAASGVRSPAVGLITASIVVLALYFLTPAFYYIPSAALPAIIIVSISDLVSRYPTFIEFWNVSFFDFLVCVTGILVTLFSNIEIGLYTSIALAMVILLCRIARPHLSQLVKLTSGHYACLDNPSFMDALGPTPGILIYRIEESLTYPNAGYICEKIIGDVRDNTLFGGVKKSNNELVWCDDMNDRLGESRKAVVRNLSDATSIQNGSPLDIKRENLSYLRDVVFDFSAVNAFDATAHQNLFDLRKLCCKFSGRVVHFHFVNVKSHLKRVVMNYLTVPLDVSDIIPLFNHGDIQRGSFVKVSDPERFMHTDIDAAVAWIHEQKNDNSKSSDDTV